MTKFKRGDKVVVSPKSNIIYFITSTNNGIAKLQYKSGNRMVGGGEFPLSCLMTPSKQQIQKYESNTKPKTRVNKWWTKEEEQIIREHYAIGGSNRCQVFLENISSRTKRAIRDKATRMGIKRVFNETPKCLYIGA